MKIALISDRRYAHSTGITIKSLLRVGTPDFIYVINDGMEEWQRQWLGSLSDRIRIVELDASHHAWLDVFSMHGSKHVTRSTYVKALLHLLLPDEERVLYLDGDVIVMKDPAPLFNSGMGDALIGATYNLAVMREGRRRLRLKGKYFNAGVLLCPLEKWRRESLHELFKNWYLANYQRVLYDDQDIFNAITDGQVHWIEKRWNVSQWEIFSMFQWISIPLSDCGIIHFNGIEKPWNPGYGRRWGLNKLYFMAATSLLKPLAAHEGRVPPPAEPSA
ncbi:MAG: glycosyltransferase [Rhodocyclaceae bacterium]